MQPAVPAGSADHRQESIDDSLAAGDLGQNAAGQHLLSVDGSAPLFSLSQGNPMDSSQGEHCYTPCSP